LLRQPAGDAKMPVVSLRHRLSKHKQVPGVRMARAPAPLLIHGWFVFLQEGQQSTEGVQNGSIHFAALRLVESGLRFVWPFRADI